MNNEAPIDYIALMQQHDKLKAAFHSLLFPCPHCGKVISENETKRYNGDLHLECACGAEVHGYHRDFIEILSIWNRRDGKDFDMSSEYAQRLAHLAGEFERFKKNAMSELRTYLKQIEELKTEKVRLELRVAELEGKPS